MSDYLKVTRNPAGCPGAMVQGNFSGYTYYCGTLRECRSIVKAEYKSNIQFLRHDTYRDLEKVWIGQHGTAGHKEAMNVIESIGGEK